MQQTLLQNTPGELLIVPSVDHPIRVNVYGDVNAPPVVLLHGLYQSARCWKKQIPVLSQSYRLIVPDLPGHGGSPGGFSADLSPKSLGDIVHTLLEIYVRSEHRAVLVGWSWAGTLLRSFLLSRGKSAVRGMILMGTSLDMRPWFADPEVQRAMTAFQEMSFSPDEKVRIQAFFQYHRQLTFSPLSAEDHYESLGYNAIAYLGGGIGPEVLQPLDDPQEMLYRDPFPPTLIIQGREDQICLAKIGRMEQQRIPGSTYIEYDRCGHSPFLEYSDRFNADARAFIQALP